MTQSFETRFKDRCVNVATLGADGTAYVQTLAEMAAAVQEAGA